MAAEDAIVTYSETETEFLAISLPSTGVQGVGRDDVPHRVAIFYLIFCASKVVFFFCLYPSVHLKEGLVLLKICLKISSNPPLFYWVKCSFSFLELYLHQRSDFHWPSSY